MEYKVGEAVASDPFLAPHVQDRLDLKRAKEKAFSGQLEINPGFDLDSGKLQNKWTQLDLYSMALKRDALVKVSAFALSKHFPLAALYTALYKSGSSVVHADASSLGPPFRGMIESDDRTLVVTAGTFWKLALPPMLVTYDLVQCYEALRWNGVSCDNEFIAVAAKLG